MLSFVYTCQRLIDLSNDCRYDLVGVLIHTGSSANAGHYTAHLRDGKQQWWKFDDESVSMQAICWNARDSMTVFEEIVGGC